MNPAIALSTRKMMWLVILAAANLLLYKGAGMILIYAPVAIAAMVLNVGLLPARSCGRGR